MSLIDSVERREESIIRELQEKQAGINDPNGKGTATERIVQTKLLDPFLPPRFGCQKGAIVTSAAPQRQSEAIDRIIFDRTACMPLVYDEDHSIFPIESVAGLVEITIRLNTSKLRSDIEHMVVAKGMRSRRYLAPIEGAKTRATTFELPTLSPRSYIVGLPEDPSWDALRIAETLRTIQVDLGPPTHVHGLYALGIGYFETIPVKNDNESKYRIRYWAGRDRLFRFSAGLRRDLDRWPHMKQGWVADMQSYLSGDPEIVQS